LYYGGEATFALRGFLGSNICSNILFTKMWKLLGMAIGVYKFPSMSREIMLNLNLLKETEVYQEAKEEGKEGIVSKLVIKDLSIQEIAELLELDAETLRAPAQA
jgi:hypothetical protein